MKGFSFSQVPWVGSWCVRLCGEQHTQEKGSRRVTLSPAASGQAGGVGRVWGAHRGCLTPLIPAPTLQVPGCWVGEGWPGAVLGCAEALWLLVLHSSVAALGQGMGTQGSWDSHDGGGFPSISQW